MKNPFSAGRWVYGPRFFGRDELINDLLHTSEPCNWVIGKRRMGKTSLLRELERRINQNEDDRLALFWDIQGSYDPSGLFDSLYDAVEDSQDGYPEIWEPLEFDLPEDHNSSTRLLKSLARVASGAGRKLVLLMDETEELMTVGKQDPGLLSKLRRFMQTNRNTLTIMVSSPRLERLGDSVDVMTSPFLHGFMAFYLGNFKDPETDKLLETGISDASARAEILRLTNGNPFQTQLIAKHYFEEPNLSEVLAQLETNPTINQTIEVNFNLLTEEEQQVLKAAHCGDGSFGDYEKPITMRLVRMGYLNLAGGRHDVSSYFLKKWLSNNLMTEAEAPRKETDVVVSGVVLNVSHKTTVLRQSVDIYKMFLEQAQQGRAIEVKEGSFLVSSDDIVVLDPKSLTFKDAEINGKPWWVAMEELAAFLDLYVPRQESWSLFRFHQMVEKGAGHYPEQEYLDLMMLIAEEAALD